MLNDIFHYILVFFLSKKIKFLCRFYFALQIYKKINTKQNMILVQNRAFRNNYVTEY